MMSLQAITKEVQMTGAMRRISSRVIRSTRGHLNPIHQHGNRTPYMTRAFSRRAPSYNSTYLPLRIHRVHGLPTNPYRSTLPGLASHSTATGTNQPTIHNIFEKVTGTWQYIVADPTTSTAVTIDPVLDYDPVTQVITTTSADTLLSLVQEKGYKIERILETHAHADHLSAASYLQSRLAQIQGYRPPIGIGKRIEQVQKRFAQRYGLADEEYRGVFDQLFDDDETFAIGASTAKAIHLPGHTPDHLGYQIGDNVFCGDSLFHADIGTARCDFPGGDATHLFQSGRKLLGLAEHVTIWPGHDYPPDGRAPAPWMSVRDQKKQNKHLRDAVTEEEFVAMRTERDQGLNAPRLLHQSLQMNIRAGRLPRATMSGHRMLYLPLKLGGVEW